MTTLFHLNITADMLEGATVALLPGDPGRVERIASELENPRFVASHREFNIWLGYSDGVPIVVCSTGIGGPSTSIAVEELGQIGIRTFLRVGTTGAIQPGIGVTDLIITQGSVRLDGASGHFAPMEYPAVSNFEVNQALVAAAADTGVPFHVGITASSDTFYPGQERYDTVSGRVIPRFRGSAKEWAELGVLNYEMESATLFVMCSTNGWRAGCIAGVLVNRALKETPDEATIGQAEANAITAAVAAARRLV